MDRDLKEAISALRLDEYKWAIEKAGDLWDLRSVERRLITDTKISANDKGQLFATSGKKRLLGKIRLHSRTE